MKAERRGLAEGKKILADEDPDLTACVIANSTSSLNIQGVSHDTINRLLISNGYQARIKRKCQDLTPDNIVERYKRAKLLRNWDILSHKSVWYSDESYLTVNERRAFVRKQDLESWNDQIFRKKKKAHPTGIHIWMMINCKRVQHMKWTCE